MFMQLSTLAPIKVGYYIAKFGGHRHSGSRDILVFVCHMTLQDLDYSVI